MHNVTLLSPYIPSSVGHLRINLCAALHWIKMLQDKKINIKKGLWLLLAEIPLTVELTSLFSSLLGKEEFSVQEGVQMLYGSMFPSSLLAVSSILLHSSDECINDSKSQDTLSSLYVSSEINPDDHINWKTPRWSQKSSVRAFPTCNANTNKNIVTNSADSQRNLCFSHQEKKVYHITLQINNFVVNCQVVLYNSLAELRHIMSCKAYIVIL